MQKGLLVFPIVVWLLPKDYFNEGDTVCLSVALLDTTCPGCGMTKALMHFYHFDFSAAYQFNKMVAIVGPLLFLVWLHHTLRAFGIDLTKALRKKKRTA
ncbi:MAG: DUF2752 domain-containing protein [Bacteroidota bacterium]